MTGRRSNKSTRCLLFSELFAICFAVTSTSFAADNPFDGTYSGTRVLTKGSDEFCPKHEEMSVTVKDGKFTFTTSNSRTLLGTIQITPNGEFNLMHTGRSTWYIRGKITDGLLEAEANSSACFHHWLLKKK